MLSTISSIFESFKKAGRLSRISKKLSEPLASATDIMVFMKQQDARKDAQNDLFDLCMENATRSQVVANFGLERKDLENIYSFLSLSGVEQWAGGRYVSASSLYYTRTLEYLLRLYKGPDSADMNNWKKASYRLIMYFQKGEMGEIWD